MKSILVHLNDSASCETRLRLAKHLSEKFNAKISGIHFSATTFALENQSVPQNLDVNNVTDINALVLNTRQKKVLSEKAAVQRKLDKIFSTDFLPSWETFIGDDGHRLIANCRYHDLMILSSTLNLGSLLERLNSTIASVASESGCPIFVIPSEFCTLPSFCNPVIVWNSGRAVARAISDGLPFLKEAKKVTVYCDSSSSNDSERRRSGLLKLSEYLTRHDVSHEIITTELREDNYSAHLLKRISEAEHDLAVIGAYDHTNVKETMLGSVTRALMQEAKIPIFLSH
ncbi:universal stress protein [Aliiglaciecola sp. M165]|uniref:universal stress protein n=1 Tax=Aliiglaciecola sp. M165 TaxID=2593649 RepID=UPI0021B11B7A|nr:universal stress protein [Aliiglaciecola sp. M165]